MRRPHIFVAVEDSDFVSSLCSSLKNAEFTCEGVNSLKALKNAVSTGKLKPDCIVLGLTFDDNEEKSLSWLQNYALFPDAAPVIVTCLKDDVGNRLAALRAGARHYFSIPLDLTYFLDAVTHLTNKQIKEPYRAMLVDDEPIALHLADSILTEAGISAKTVKDPYHSLNVLEIFKPEVVILDLFMPEVSGFELSALIREKNEGRDVPILMLSAETDIKILEQATKYGADHFISKPVESSVLVDEVKMRAKRYRAYRLAQSALKTELYERQMEHDTLDNHAMLSVFNPNGELTHVNDYFCEVSGYSRIELMGKSHEIVSSHLHSQEFYEEIENRLNNNESWHGEICNKNKNGDLFWVYTTITPFINDRNELYKVVCIQTDITQGKKDAETLREARNEAQKANQAKSRFLANMSHELRTPLNAIVGFSQLLEADPNLSVDSKQDLSEIISASNHLVELINDVLDLSKIEAGHLELRPEEFSLNVLLRECIQLISTMANDKGIVIYSDFEEPIQCFLDKTRLRQALLNLLSNAVKYNVVNGSIHVSAKAMPSLLFKIEIADTGQGIQETEIDNLFQPFSRLEAHKHTQEGTGIGLALTKQIINQMDGDIRIDLSEKSETRFVIELPSGIQFLMDKDYRSETVDYSAQTASISSTKLRVFYVDDNEVNLRVITGYLQKNENIDLVSTHKASEAIKIMEEQNTDVALIDIRMPDIDGYTLLKQLRKNELCQKIKAIAVSANAMPDDIQQAMNEGFDDYITKPVSFDELDRVLMRFSK